MSSVEDVVEIVIDDLEGGAKVVATMERDPLESYFGKLVQKMGKYCPRQWEDLRPIRGINYDDESTHPC